MDVMRGASMLFHVLLMVIFMPVLEELAEDVALPVIVSHSLVVVYLANACPKESATQN